MDHHLMPPSPANSLDQACWLASKTGQPQPIFQEIRALLETWGASGEVLAAALLGPLAEEGSLAPEEIRSACGHEIAELCQGYSTHLGSLTEWLGRVNNRPPLLARLFLAGYCDPRLAIIAAAMLWQRCVSPDGSHSQAVRSCSGETQRDLTVLLEMLGMWSARKALEVCLRQRGKGRGAGGDGQGGLNATPPGHQELFGEVIATLSRFLPEAALQRRMISLARANDQSGSIDVLGIDVLVDGVAACYDALCQIHQLWRPTDRAVKDYIGASKVNGYRCLRTTVSVPSGASAAPVKFHIQTHEMKEINNWGVAAVAMRQRLQPDLPNAWWNQRQKWYGRLTAAPVGSLPDKVCVFSPLGQVFEFQRGCTVVDYAYQVHSELADQCVRFVVNGDPCGPTTVLRHLDVVELEREAGAPGPTRVWLDAARTSRARLHINRFLKRQGGNSLAGQTTLDRKLADLENHYGFTLPQHRIEQTLLQASRRLHPPTLEQLLIAIADGRVSPDRLLHPLFADEILRQVELPETLKLYPRHVKLCQSCRPRIGEDICGRLRYRGNQVSGIRVHRTNCFTLTPAERYEPLRWRLRQSLNAFADLEIGALDEPGLLGRALQPIYDQHPSVTLHQVTATAQRGAALIRFTVEADKEDSIDEIIGRLNDLTAGTREAVRRLKPSFYVLERLNRASSPVISNPYSRLPVREREMFFGRNQELTAIMRHVQSNDSIVFLRGRKRIGKTSLLWHLRDYYLEPRQFVPCYIDFQLFGALSGDRSPWFDIADAAFLDLQKNGRIGDVGPPLRDLFGEAPARQLASYFARLQTHFAPRRLVFLIDEFSVVIDAYRQGNLPGEFFHQWRGLLQVTGADIAYVIVVQQHTWEASAQSALSHTDDPIWQLLELGNSFLLRALDDDAIRDLISRPTRNILTYAPDVLDRAVRLTGASPYIGQAFCHALVQHMSNQPHHEVTLQDVDAVASQFIAAGDSLFKHVLQGAGPATYAVCSSLDRLAGLENTPVDSAAVQTQLPNLNNAALQGILHTLCEQAIVRQTGAGHWQFASLLFRRWLAANAR